MPSRLVQLGEQLAGAPYDVELQRIYADALIEEGGDQAIRGELIQLELTEQDSERRRELSADVSIARAARGLAGLGAANRVGLARDWDCSADQFARHGELAFAEEPLLRWITIQPHDTRREMRVLAAAPTLARVRCLSIIGKASARLGANGIATLLESPHWPRNLERLQLANCRVHGEGAVRLASAPSLSRLESLDLWANGVDERGLIALARSPFLERLEFLGLWQNLPGPRGIAALATPENRMPLVHLRLDKRQMFPEPSVHGFRGSRSMIGSPIAKMIPVETIIAAAEAIEDLAERAAYLHARFATTEDRAQLVKPWFEAAVKVPDHREALAEGCLALRDAFAGDAAFLDALGLELWRWSFTEEAIAILRAARAAGSDVDMTIMLLGCLLLKQDDDEGVALVETALDRSNDWPMPRRALAGWFATREPGRTVALLASATAAEELDLRAVANAALDRLEEADRDERAALATFDNEREARMKLAKWHVSNDRHERALVHARALLALIEHVRLSSKQRDEIDATLAHVYRLNGAFAELLPRFRRQRRAFSRDAAWHIFSTLVALQPNPDPMLAIKCARAIAEDYREDGSVREALKWEVRAASVPARATNDVAMLDEIVASDALGDDAEAWVEVAHHYLTANHHDVATAAADRALVIDENYGDALYVMCRIALSLGDHEALHRVAQATADRKPTWHQGPEFLARSHARRLDVAEALRHSERAVAMASYCNNAWISRAEAFVVAGDFDAARACLTKAERIHPSKLGDETRIIRAALDRDPDELELQLAERAKNLPSVPFPDYVAYLRRLAATRL